MCEAYTSVDYGCRRRCNCLWWRPDPASEACAVDEQRLTDIETKIAHQEHLLAELNDALSSQQAQLLHLKSLCDTLVDRLRSLAEAGLSK